MPLVSVCLKDSLNFVVKSSKVLRERVVEMEAEAKASCWKEYGRRLDIERTLSKIECYGRE